MPFAITVTKKKKEKKAAAADSSRLRFTRLRNVLMLTTDCAATVCRGLVASGGDCRTKTKDRIRFALASVRPTPRTHSFCARLLFKIADCVKFAGRMCVCASRVCVGCARRARVQLVYVRCRCQRTFQRTESESVRHNERFCCDLGSKTGHCCKCDCGKR